LYLQSQEECRDIVIFVFVPAGLKGFMSKCNLEMYQDYCKLIEQIGEMKNVIFDDNPTSDMLWTILSICDEYYGDECRLAEICRKYDVPITLRKDEELL
jgi:hypothetical protein